jgi:prophage antirepressor-like protein
MDSIVKYACDELDGVEISCLLVEGDPWFCGVEVARVLQYANPSSTIYKMDLKYKSTLQFLLSRVGLSSRDRLEANDLKASWINEAGLYKLVLKSTLKSAAVFQDWVCMEVLPSIRKTGSYALPPPAQPALVGKQIKLLNETDLHNKVVDLLRNTFPELKPVPGLGELQDTPIKRSDAYKKGYVGGQPDIMILNQTSKYNGFAIELKTPKGNGVIRDNQISYLDSLKDLKYKTLISNDYDEIVVELTRYYDDLRFPCPHCSKTFKSTRTRSGHIRACH